LNDPGTRLFRICDFRAVGVTRSLFLAT